jgi:LuxR family quorum-sensing system transcriptional regulator SolR
LENEIVYWLQLQTFAFAEAKSVADLFKVMVGAARDLGFDYCAYGMRWPLPLSKPKLFMINNYSSEWQDRYASANYFQVDPTVAHCLRSAQPLIWSESLFENKRDFWEEASGCGLNVGWAQSFYDPKGIVSMLTFARTHDKLDDAELAGKALRMSWIGQAALQEMTRLMGPQNLGTPQISLTAREIEVLRWTADGKTSGEVAEIMNITERTVNFHVNNTLEKLGASNKTAGVIKAAMLRLI